MLKKIIIISFFVFGSVLPQWVSTYNGLPGNWSRNGAISATDKNNAVIAVYSYPQSYIYKTTNSGEFWTEIPTPDSDDEITISDITMLADGSIWICTGGTAPERAAILKTTNDGTTWETQFEDKEKTNFFNYIKMFDELNGIAMGDSPSGDEEKPALFLMTFNGGITWEVQSDTNFIGAFSGARWHSLDFYTVTNGLFIPSVSGETSTEIYRTKNSASDWDSFTMTNNVDIVKMFDKENFFAYGEGTAGAVRYYSEDGGVNWVTELSSLTNLPVDFAFIKTDKAKLWLTDGEGLYYSNDMGDSFIDYTPYQQFAGIDIEITTDKAGWVLTDKDVLFIENSDITVTGISNVENMNGIPESFSLEQNYPNPFNPSTTIRFTIKDQSEVRLNVYDVLGNIVTRLVNNTLSAGTYNYSFNTSEDGYNLSSGIYFYELIAENFKQVRKMTLIK